jgi:hypothetical protein
MKITITNLFRVARKFLRALVQYASLPVAHVSESTLKAALKDAKAKRTAHVAATRATRVATSKQKKLREAAIAFAELCRDTLMPALGRSWSNAWIPAGWKRNTLSVPRALDGVVALLEDLEQFLTDHEELENDKYEVTAEKVQEYLERLEAAAGELSTAQTTQRTAKTAREKAEATLMGQTRGLVDELGLILAENDERWISFTGEVPADEQRPEPVEGVVLTSDTPGQLDVDWEKPARSERFLVEIQIVGVDAEFRRAATVKDTNVTLTDLPPGAEVKVRVTAANAAGEAAPSDEETARVLALPKAA